MSTVSPDPVKRADSQRSQDEVTVRVRIACYNYSTARVCVCVCVCVFQALGDSDLAAVLKQVLPLIKSACGSEGSEAGSGSGEEAAVLGADDLLALLVFLYSLSEEAHPGEGEEAQEKVERELIGALTLLLTKQTQLSPLLQ